MAGTGNGGFNVNAAAAGGIQQAGMGAGYEMGYQPMAIGAPSQATLQQYTNPYENQVVQQSLKDLERSRQMQQNMGDYKAGASRSFGGSRHGVADSETNRAYLDEASRTASELRLGGYNNALGMAREADITNQGAGLAASQQRLAAGGQLADISNLGFGMGQDIQNRMDRQGAMQQMLQQQLINEAKGQYQGYTGSPVNSLSAMLAAVGGAPSSSATTGGYDAGLFDYLSLGLGNAAGIKKAFF